MNKHVKKGLASLREAGSSCLAADLESGSLGRGRYGDLAQRIWAIERELVKVDGDFAEAGLCPYCDAWFDEGCTNEDHQERAKTYTSKTV